MTSDLASISPLLIVATSGFISLLVGVFTPHDTFKGWLGYVTSAGYLLALVACVFLWDAAPVAFETQSFVNALTVDAFGLAFCCIILAGAFLSTLTAIHYLPEQRSDHGEYYALVAFSTLGMMVLVLAADMMTFFIGLELMSIPIYILAGFKRHSRFSTESALKYFIIGAFASAVLLMGIAFTYGGTGEITFAGIGHGFLENADGATALGGVGMLFILVAFLIKVAAAPFHMWMPDVYEGAPSPVSGFMAVGVKAAAFAGFARLLLTCFGTDEFRQGAFGWEGLVATIAVISMFGGNLMALGQKNLKRMLGYSAIAHTGYLLIALLVVPRGPGGVALNALGGGLILYLLAYTFANVAAFGVAAAVSGDDTENIDDTAYAGLARRSPGLAFALTIAMLSLLGIPLTAGFMGKISIFGDLLSTTGNDYLWLVVVAVINSVISAWYYLRVIMAAYMRPESKAQPIQLITSRPMAWGIALATIATLILGTLPDRAMRASSKAGRSLAATAIPGVRPERATQAKSPVRVHVTDAQ